MREKLSWTVNDGCLVLSGELEHQTLLPLWQQREVLMRSVTHLNLSGLERVDTSGLALLIHLRQLAEKQNNVLTFAGETDKLHSLIDLYNLRKLITEAS